MVSLRRISVVRTLMRTRFSQKEYFPLYGLHCGGRRTFPVENSLDTENGIVKEDSRSIKLLVLPVYSKYSSVHA